MRSEHRLIAGLPILALLFTASHVGSETPDKVQGAPKKAQTSSKKAQASTSKKKEYPPTIQYPSHISAGHSPPSAGVLKNPYKGNKDMATAGAGLFSQMNCDGCHGGGAAGFAAPSLADGRWRYGNAAEEIFQSIYYGRPKGMPAFGGVLGADGIWILVTYLQALPVPDNIPTQSWEATGPVASAVAVPVAATETPAAKPATAASAATKTAAAKPATSASATAMFGKYACVACHAVDKKVVGPSYKDVAAKYRGKSGSQKTLVEKVRKGGMGVWGQIPMSPNPSVPDEDLNAMVKWILALK